MTLQTTGSLSLTDVMNELRIANPSRAYPISLGDADVLALAGKSAPPISLSDLYGKSAYVALTATGHGDSNFSSSTLHGGTAACSPNVTYTGGKAPISFLWSFTSNPNGCTLSNATSQTCLVSKSYSIGDNGNATATLQCVVSDGRSSSTASGVSALLEWGN